MSTQRFSRLKREQLVQILSVILWEIFLAASKGNFMFNFMSNSAADF